MTDSNKPAESTVPDVIPLDVVNGLALVERPLIATALALFEDSTLSKRLSQVYEAGRDRLSRVKNGEPPADVAAKVATSRQRWIESPHDDDTLRLLLWIHIRDAFGLPARLAVSERSARSLADDLSAAVIFHVDPPGLIKSAAKAAKARMSDLGLTRPPKSPVALRDVIQPVLEALIQESEKVMEGLSEAEREKVQQEAEEALRRNLDTMSEEDKQKLADLVGADELNNAALAKILATTGGLTAFSVSVKLAGFSAYILAAKASAFIPFMSGPAVVSLVAVLANPITVVGGSALVGWLAVKSAGSAVKREVALRVIALLALRGLGTVATDMKSLLRAFAKAGELKPVGQIKQPSIDAYKAEWALLEPCMAANDVALAESVRRAMERPAAAGEKSASRLRRLLFPGETELADSTLVAGLSLGDVLYSAAAIDPTVMAAADFARVEDLSDTLSFSDFARRIEEMAPESYRGAISNLKGYTAEHVVASQLVMQGHQVSFPDAANEAGWDLLVDGEKFQVKCVGSAGDLADHFERYDFPVIANAELADSIPDEWADQVFFVDGYTDELVSHVTEASVAHGADVHSPDVPLFAISVSLLRNYLEYRQGKVTAEQAAEQFVVDGAVRAGLATTGKFAGAGLGLLIFGPAGAVVLGVALPVLAQAQAARVRGLMKQAGLGTIYENWKAKLQLAMDSLAARLEAALTEKKSEIRAKQQELSSGIVSGYVRYRLGDDAIHIEEQRARLRAIMNDSKSPIEIRAPQLLAWIGRSTVYPHWYQAELRRVGEVCEDRPGGITQATDVVADVAGKLRNAGTSIFNSLRTRRKEQQDSDGADA